MRKTIILIIVALLIISAGTLWIVDINNLGASYRLGTLLLTGVLIYGTVKSFGIAQPYVREELLIVRFEKSQDCNRTRTIHLTSFPNADEADLVDNLRSSQTSVYSMVAQLGDTVIGHCMLSRMDLPRKTLALGPVAVMPEYRKLGVAEQMISTAIEEAKLGKWTAIFVVGNPRYYQRFGFEPKLAENFPSPYGGPAFMALPLDKAKFDHLNGPAKYPLAFNGV